MTDWVAKWTKVGSHDGYVIQWGPLLSGDTAQPVIDDSNVTGYADRSVQVNGTFGGATVALAGSNDGVNFETLSDPTGVALSFTANKLKAVLEAPRQIKPVISAGDGTTAVTVSLFMRKLR